MMSFRLIGLALLSVGLWAQPGWAQANRPGDVSFYIGYPPGSAYEIYARLISRYFGDHLPGEPTVVLRHMPGASSLVLANYLFNVAPKDGYTLGGLHERMGIEPLVNPTNAKFDGTQFTWIGSALKTTDVCMVWHTAPAQTIDEAKQKQVVVGGTHSAGSGALVPRILNALIGTKFKLVIGYDGPDMFLAMERGELEGRCGMSWSGLKASKPDWLRDKKIKILIQMGVSKHADLQDVPLIMDLVSGSDDRVALDYLFSTQEAGRPYAAPPGIPEERKIVLRRAFDDTLRDPKLLAEAEKGGIELAPISGAEVEEITQRLYRTPKAVIERVEAFRTAGPDSKK